MSDPLTVAEQALRDARGLQLQYRVEESGRLLDAAVSALGEADRLGVGDAARRTEVRVRVDIARTFHMEHQPALAALEALAEQLLAQGRTDLLALPHMQRGYLYGRASALVESLQALDEAVRWADPLAPVDRSRLLANRALARLELMMFDDAAADLSTALALAEGGKDARLATMVRHNLGWVQYQRGDLPQALHLLEPASLELDNEEAVASLDRARVLLDCGLVDEAAALLQRCVPVLTEAGLVLELETATLDLARCALVRGEHAEARARAQQVLDQAVAEAAWGRAARAALLLLTVDGSPAQVEALTPVIERAGGERSRSMLVLHRAAALLGAGQVDDAAHTLAQAGDVLATEQFSERCRYRALSARIAVERGATDQARRVVAAAAADVAAVKAGVASLDLRTGLSMHLSELIETDLHLATCPQGDGQPRPGEAERLLEATERWRTATEIVTDVTPAHDPDDAAQWARLRRLREDLRTAGGEADGDLAREVAAAEQVLREHTWARQSRSGAPPAGAFERANVAQLDAALVRDRTVLLSYLTIGENLEVVVKGPDTPAARFSLGPVGEVVRLARRASADLDALAATGHGPLRGSVESGLRTGLAELSRLVLPPHCLPEGTRDGVVLVPITRLFNLPWGLLPPLLGRGVTVARSATSWARHGQVMAAQPVVATAAGPDLGLSEDEAERVAARWPRGTRLPSTRTALVEALATSDVVHVAAHGEHRIDSPLFSSLRLGDGVVFAHEFEGLHLRASLVILSACRLGRAEVRRGDEPLGLTACLLSRGVSAVVAPVARVPDDVAVATMTRLHGGLHDGLPVADALAQAVASGPPVAGAFTCFGAPWRAPADTEA